MKYQQQSLPVINARSDGKSITSVSETFERRNKGAGTASLQFFKVHPGGDFPGGSASSLAETCMVLVADCVTAAVLLD